MAKDETKKTDGFKNGDRVRVKGAAETGTIKFFDALAKLIVVEYQHFDANKKPTVTTTGAFVTESLEAAP